MDDLYRFSNREKYYQTSAYIKRLLRALQTAETVDEINDYNNRLVKGIECIVEIKTNDLNDYKEHMHRMLTDICERGL